MREKGVSQGVGQGKAEHLKLHLLEQEHRGQAQAWRPAHLAHLPVLWRV